MSKLTYTLLSLLFFFRTGKTTCWLNRLYGELCALDMTERLHFQLSNYGAELLAGGNTVDFKICDGSKRIIMSDASGVLVIREEHFLPGVFDPEVPNSVVTDTGTIVFKEVYRDGKTTWGLEWVWRLTELKSVIASLQRMNKKS